MKHIRPFIGTELIKAMIGIHCCGKSVMLELIERELTEFGVSPTQFVPINFEDMPIHTGYIDGFVSHARGNGGERETHVDQKGDVRVPLRYNYDKPEKTRISRVFGYLARFFILFQTEKSSREVVIS